MYMPALFAQSPINYVINGKATAVKNGTKVYMKLASSGGTPKDSAIVEDGKFKMEGSLKSKDIVHIYIGDREIRVDAVLDGSAVYIDFDNEHPYPEGGELNKRMTKYMKDNEIILKRAKVLRYDDLMEEARRQTITEAYRKEIYKLLADSLENPYKELVRKTIYDNIDNVFGAYVFSKIYNTDADEALQILKRAGREFKEYKPVENIQEWFNHVAETSVGKHFTDFKQADPEGGMHRISDYAGRGKYVLLVFWASWCGPYYASGFHEGELYRKYRPKGLVIIGVSLDSNKESWVRGVARHKMKWLQVSDLKGWNNAISSAYAINSIPATVLIGPDGTIIARGLRGEALAAKLAEIYK